MDMYLRFKLLIVNLWLISCLTLSIQAVELLDPVGDSPLFTGGNSDLWLIDANTGAISGYNFNRWLDDFSDQGSPLMILSNSEYAIVNNVAKSSLNMTINQPTISIVGLDDGNGNISDSVQDSLKVFPLSASSNQTINVQMMVDGTLLQSTQVILSWQNDTAPADTTVLSSGLLSSTNLVNGYYVKSVPLIHDGTYNLTIKITDTNLNLLAEVSRVYIISSDHADGFRRDTDGDGIPDLVEAEIGLDVEDSDFDHDTDGDGWSDFDEWLRADDIDPITGMPKDSDNDGWSDFDESLRLTNPLDAEPTISPEADQTVDSELYIQAVKRYKDFPTARRLYEVESLISGTLTATATAQGMLWSQVRADSVNGLQYYNSQKLLTDEEITKVNLPVNSLPDRLRDFSSQDALANNLVPSLRLPAGDSMVVSAIHQIAPITQVYKHWIHRSDDLTPEQFYVANGAGTWNTAQEWKTSYIQFLQNGLVVNKILAVDLAQSTANVGLLEGFISHEARLYDGKYVDIQLFGNDASPIDSKLIDETEQTLVKLTASPTAFDDLYDSIVALTASGQPLYETKNWAVSVLSNNPGNIRSDRILAAKFIKSFDEETLGCYVEQAYLDQLAADGGMDAFLIECPTYYTTESLTMLYAEDAQKLYLLRLMLFPDGLYQSGLEPTLTMMAEDSDGDTLTNRQEMFRPLVDVTLPWLSDHDGDNIADADDMCPFDAENLCSSTPTLPVLYTTDSVIVYEPSTGESFVLISFTLNKPALEDVVIRYKTRQLTEGLIADNTDYVEISEATVTIPAGETVALVKILIRADSIEDSEEQFYVDIISATNVTLDSNTTTLVTIYDPVGGPIDPPVGDPPSVAAVASIRYVPVKKLRFTWTDVADASYYTLLEDADGSANFTPVGENIIAGEEVYEHIIPLYARINAQYRLQSCNDFGCIDSNNISAINYLDESVGFFKASNSQFDNLFFGYSVKVSADGSTMAVGGYGEASTSTGIDSVPNQAGTDRGAVYIFRLVEKTWTQQAYIKSSINVSDGAMFGWTISLSADGNTLAVGAHGDRHSNTGINSTPQPADLERVGAAFVYKFDGTSWSEHTILKPPLNTVGQQFGYSVSLSDDGTSLAVSANNESSSTSGINAAPADTLVGEAGAVFMYRFDGTNWSQQAYIKPSFVEFSSFINDHFGESVALSADGNTLAVGVVDESSDTSGINPLTNNLDASTGAAYIFRYDGSNWYEQAFIKASVSRHKAYFGASVALSDDGNTLAVGAPYEDSGTAGINTTPDFLTGNDNGAAYIFRFNGADWTEQAYIKASNSDFSDDFGRSVDLNGDGNALIVGASQEDGSDYFFNPNDNNDYFNPGAAYLYLFEAGNWSENVHIKSPIPDDAEFFGTCVSISSDGKTIAIGAYLEASSAVGIDGDKFNNDAFGTGAVYVY